MNCENATVVFKLLLIIKIKIKFFALFGWTVTARVLGARKCFSKKFSRTNRTISSCVKQKKEKKSIR